MDRFFNWCNNLFVRWGWKDTPDSRTFLQKKVDETTEMLEKTEQDIDKAAKAVWLASNPTLKEKAREKFFELTNIEVDLTELLDKASSLNDLDQIEGTDIGTFNELFISIETKYNLATS